MKEYDQKQLVANIFAVMEQEGKKIGEVEKRAGLSAGYLSRMSKGEKSAPSAETVWRIAGALEVSMEWLITGRGERRNERGEYLRQFIERLYEETQAGRLEWGRVTVRDVNRMLYEGKTGGFPSIDEAPEGETFRHMEPVFRGEDPTNRSFYASLDWKRRIRPVTRPDSYTNIAGSSFWAELTKEQRLWVIPYMERMLVNDAGEFGNVVWYELVTVNRETEAVLPVCASTPGNEMIAPEIGKLYTELKMHEWEIRIVPEVRPMIDEFMERTAPGK